MVKIDILGSCVSRDAFNFSPKDMYKVGDYFARTSLISIYSAGYAINPETINLSSAFQRRIVGYDLNKDFRHFSQRSTGNFIVVDFIDERFRVAQVLTNKSQTFDKDMDEQLTFVTRSNEFNLAKFDWKLMDISEQERTSLWEAACCKFAYDLVENYNENQIVIHRAYWKTSYRSKDGVVLKFSNQTEIKRNNNLLKHYYDFLQNLLPNRVHVVDIPDFFADENHMWGLSFFHYEDAYYMEFNERLKNITES